MSTWSVPSGYQMRQRPLGAPSPHVVSASLGHNNVSTTMNVYAHVLPDQREQVARTLDRIFGG